MTVPAPYKRNTVVLKSRGYHEDAPAGGTILPGHLIKMTSTGTVVVHATAGGAGELCWAKEDALQGKWFNDSYASGDIVSYIQAVTGDHLLVLIPAGAAAITAGDQLTSNGDGTLKKGNGTTDFVYGYSEDTIDNSGGASAVYCAIRVK